LPVLRLDEIATFAENLHGRSVAFGGLHKTVQLNDVLIVSVLALCVDCENSYDSQDS